MWVKPTPHGSTSHHVDHSWLDVGAHEGLSCPCTHHGHSQEVGVAGVTCNVHDPHLFISASG